MTNNDREKEVVKEEKGKIFNSIPVQTQNEPDKISDMSDDDEWGAVPAFLRRSKLK
jgi:hypothetical protein